MNQFILLPLLHNFILWAVPCVSFFLPCLPPFLRLFSAVIPLLRPFSLYNPFLMPKENKHEKVSASMSAFIIIFTVHSMFQTTATAGEAEAVVVAVVSLALPAYKLG